MKNYWLDKRKVPNLLSDADIIHLLSFKISEINEDKLEAYYKLQKLEELKLQIKAMNPSILGVPLK